MTNRTPGLVIEVDAHQHVPGQFHPAHLLLLALAELPDVLLRHLSLEDPVLEVHRLAAVLDVLLDALLVTGVAVDHVPVALSELQTLAQVHLVLGLLDDLNGCLSRDLAGRLVDGHRIGNDLAGLRIDRHLGLADLCGSLVEGSEGRSGLGSLSLDRHFLRLDGRGRGRTGRGEGIGDLPFLVAPLL